MRQTARFVLDIGHGSRWNLRQRMMDTIPPKPLARSQTEEEIPGGGCVAVELPTAKDSPSTQQERAESANKVKGGAASGMARFCEESFTSPESTQQGSQALLDTFDDGGLWLSGLVQPSNLVMELRQGCSKLSRAVVTHWTHQGETQKLVRLAEGLSEAQPPIKTHEGAQVLALLASLLGILRPASTAAPHWLASSKPNLRDAGDQNLLKEAVQWVSVGQVLAPLSLEDRLLWNRRLRDSENEWEWESPDSLAALRRLGSVLSPSNEYLSLFEAVTPRCWWELWTDMSGPRPERSDTLGVKALEQASDKKARSRVPAFMVGILAGAAAMMLTTKWVSYPWETSEQVLPPKAMVAASSVVPAEPPVVVEKKEKKETDFSFYPVESPVLEVPKNLLPKESAPKPEPEKMEVVATTTPREIPESPEPVQSAAPAKAGEEVTVTPLVAEAPTSKLIPDKAEPALAATNDAQEPLMGPPAPQAQESLEGPPVPQQSQPGPAPDEANPEVAVSPEMKMRMEASSQFAKDRPLLQRLHNLVKNGSAREALPHVQGQTMMAPTGSEAHQTLLRWLLLDPPEDPEVREQVSKIAARTLAPDVLYETLRMCLHPDSPNLKESQECAELLLALSGQELTENQRKILEAEGQ